MSCKSKQHKVATVQTGCIGRTSCPLLLRSTSMLRSVHLFVSTSSSLQHFWRTHHADGRKVMPSSATLALCPSTQDSTGAFICR